MIKVWKHGTTISVKNPITGEDNVMVNVTFIEEGRTGANSKLANSSGFLSSLLGEEVGFVQLRVHTQPIKAEKIHLFPLGKEIEGHINRGLYSTPQMRVQEEVVARMVDGRPTYFTTWIDQDAKNDEDYRVSNEALISVLPGTFTKARVRAAEVYLVSESPINAEELVS